MIWIGKLKTVRLTGKELEALRQAVFERDQGRCVACNGKVFDGVHECCDARAHMAHVRNKRMYGDTMDNCVTKCRRCHMDIEHRGGKVVPRKVIG